MSRRDRHFLIMMSLLVYFCHIGCVRSITLAEHDVIDIKLTDALNNRSPYPCVCLRLNAATPIHVVQDPERTSMSIIDLRDISLLTGRTVVDYGPAEGSMVYPFVSYRATMNIYCSVGFNPSIMGVDRACDEYWRIRERTKTAGHLDCDYEKYEKEIRRPAYRVQRSPTELPIIPLYYKAPDGATQIIVNHSVIEFLLARDSVWSCIRRRYATNADRESIAVLCLAIHTAVEAHREKWPLYRWEPGQAAVIAWCTRIGARAEKRG